MLEVDLDALGAAAGPIQMWILPALLGLGLASATGLRTFLPLLMLALAARFEVFGVRLIDQMDWLVSWPAIAALGVATMAEFLGDKVPAIDHGLNAVGYVTRPVAGAIAAGRLFRAVDPARAAVGGPEVGAPAAPGLKAPPPTGRAVSPPPVSQTARMWSWRVPASSFHGSNSSWPGPRNDRWRWDRPGRDRARRAFARRQGQACARPTLLRRRSEILHGARAARDAPRRASRSQGSSLQGALWLG